MEQPAAFRVQPGQLDDAVQSIGANPRFPLHRKVTVDLDEVGGEDRMEPITDLRIETRKWSTAEHGRSDRESSTSWRKLDRIATTRVQPRRNLESRLEWIPRPRQWLFFPDYKTGENAVVLYRG
jgi:hypothetical protein